MRVVLGLLGLATLGLILYAGGISAWQRVLRADPLWVGVAFTCTVLLTYVSAGHWALIANSVAGNRVCSTRAYYYYLMMGKTVGLVLPEAVGVYAVGPLAMRAQGHASFRLAFGTLFLDKMFDLGLSGLLLLPTVAFALQVVSLQVCALLFVLVFVGIGVAMLGWYKGLVALVFRLRDWLADCATGHPMLRRALRGRAVGQLLALSADQVPPRGIALAAYGFTVLRYLLMTARFASVSQAVGVAVPPLLLFVGIPIAQLGLLLAVTPGAIGTLEAGWLGVLLIAGLPRQEIATFLIGQRAALFVFILVLGSISYVGSLIFPFPRGVPSVDGREG